MIAFEEFEKIVNFLKEYDNKAHKIDIMLAEMSEDFHIPLMSGISSRHETIIVSLLNKIFNLKDIEYIGTDLEYWIYDLEFGTKWTPSSVTDENGKSIKIQTTREIYDYLVENYERERK